LKSASWETAITRVVITSPTVAFIGRNPLREPYPAVGTRILRLSADRINSAGTG
jgi:hypothetical protein